MNRHRFEPARLVFGVLLMAVAATYLLDALAGVRVPGWVLLAVVPSALAVAACTALVTFLVRRRLRQR